MPVNESDSGRRSSSLLIPLIGAIIGFIAALFLLRELDIFEGSPPPPPSLSDACTYPVGSYYDQLCNLVARATEELQATIDPETALRCVESSQDSQTSQLGQDCREHREHLRVGLPTSERFRDALFDLSPTEQAQDWHGRYLTAISQLHSGYYAQFQALQAVDYDEFITAHGRTTTAAADAGALFDDFQVAFTDLRQ